MDRVRVVLNLFILTEDIEYTLGYVNLNNINTIQELFNAVYNLLDLNDLYNGYIVILDFDSTIILKSHSTQSDLNIFKNALMQDPNNYIYVRTIFEFLNSNPSYKNREYLRKWLKTDNKIRDPKLYSDVNYGIGL